MPPASISRVDLAFRQNLDLELFQKKVEVWLRRILVLTRFKTPTGWTQPYEAIVDTGAPLSILPARFWKQIEADVLCADEIAGIVPEAKLSVQTGEVAASLMDRNHSLPALRFKAHLSDDDRIPLVLGFDGVLSRSILHVDSLQSQGYLDFP